MYSIRIHRAPFSKVSGLYGEFDRSIEALQHLIKNGWVRRNRASYAHADSYTKEHDGVSLIASVVSSQRIRNILDLP